MTAQNFAYWVQGFFELSNVTELNAEQTESIKRHLNMVFAHDIDPKIGDVKYQHELNEIHNAPFIQSSHGSRPDKMRC